MLLSDQEQIEQWNQIVKDEISGAYLGVQNSATSAKILEMIENDKQAITENSQKFHKLVDEYIIAKRQLIIHHNAVNELIAKKTEQEQIYNTLQTSAKKEEQGIEKLSESGTSQTDSHKRLEKELQDQVASQRTRIDEMKHLIDKTVTSRDQWQKKTHSLYQQLQALMKLDKVQLH